MKSDRIADLTPPLGRNYALDVVGSDAPHTPRTSGAPRRALRAFVLIPRPVRRCRTGSGAQSSRSARSSAPRICFWFFPVLACIAEQSPMSRHTTGDPDEGARDNVKCIIPPFGGGSKSHLRFRGGD